MDDHRIHIQDTLNLANKLQKSLPKLMQMQNDALNKLPEDQRKKIAKHQSKINEMMRVARSGDINAMNDILKEHNADTNIK